MYRATALLTVTALLLVLTAPISAAESCTTIIEVFDCGEQAVPDRKVKVINLDGDLFKERTDESGRATVDVCHDQISRLRVSGVNTNHVSQTIVIESTDTSIRATITLNICGS